MAKRRKRNAFSNPTPRRKKRSSRRKSGGAATQVYREAFSGKM